MNKIILYDGISDQAMSDIFGIMIRNRILKIAKESDKDIIVDFKGMNYFDLEFFNSCFGYLLIYWPRILDGLKLANISLVGNHLFQASIDNAKIVKKRMGY